MCLSFKHSSILYIMPKQPSGDILKLEIRLTPPDQSPITEWYIDDLKSDCKVIVCGEGEPNGTPKLHYHCYIETTVSLSSVRKWIMKVLSSHKEDGVEYNGNSLYFTRKPHEYTIPYIIKSGNVLVRVGYSQSHIDEYFKQSTDYVKDKNNKRKKQQRSRIDEMVEVFAEVEKDLKDRTISGYNGIVSRALAICHSKGYDFPTRPVMERYVLKLMYSQDEYLVRSFYTKSFDLIRT